MVLDEEVDGVVILVDLFMYVVFLSIVVDLIELKLLWLIGYFRCVSELV